MAVNGTAIVTGASQGIGAGLVTAFLDADYNVVATALDVTRRLTPSPRLVVVDGDIGDRDTGAAVVGTASQRFGTVDVLVNNAGIYRTERFTDFSSEDIRALFSTNLLGFIYVTQAAVTQMLKQRSGVVVSISGSLADHPIAGVNASVSMMTKGGINSITRNLAIEYAKDGLRFNAVAPGVVNTPLHKNDPQDHLRTLQPLGGLAEVADVVDAVLYLVRARQVTGEVLHVDGGAHVGRW